jgi:transposase
MSTDMGSFNYTNQKEVVTGVQCRRLGTPEQKLDLVRQTLESGMTVSMAARRASLAATHLFQLKKA